MTEKQWLAFENFRADFKNICAVWHEQAQKIGFSRFVSEIAAKDTPFYEQQTHVVYNKALDDVTAKSDIRFIVIGDNPGKDEQLAKNQRYLVGQSGKLAERFFRLTPELSADFRKNAIILNKTPIHTAKTTHLRTLAKMSGEAANMIAESQRWLAEKTAALHTALNDEAECQLWLVGYAELKKNGIFSLYKEAFAKSYAEPCQAAWQNVFVFQHFSMNRFTIDLQKHIQREDTSCSTNILQALCQLGAKHRQEIFTFA